MRAIIIAAKSSPFAGLVRDVGGGEVLIEPEARERGGRVPHQALVRAADDVGRGGHRLQTADVAAGALDALGVDGDVPELAREAGGAAPEPAVEDERAADAGADGDVEHVAAAAPRAGRVLAESARVGVVVERDGEAGGLCERGAQVFAHDRGEV